MAKTPRQIAEEAMPGWQAIQQNPVDRATSFGSDAVGLDLEQLRRKYLPGYSGPAGSAAGADRTAPGPSGEHSDFVVMAPKGKLNSPALRKTVVVRGGKPVGSQG